MKRIFGTHNEGTSLVELMIGVGLLSLIGAAATTFFTRVNTADALARAQAKAGSDATTYISVVAHDFDKRDLVQMGQKKSFCPAGQTKCDKFDIVRKVNDGTNYVDMKISYSNLCVADNKAEFKANGAWAFDSVNLQKIMPKTACLGVKVVCAPGYRNTIVIDPEGNNAPGTPVYPLYNSGQGRVVFPNFTSGQFSYRLGIIGAAVCAESADADLADKVIIETVYVNAEEQIKVEKRDILLPRRNVAKIQLLPQ